MAIILSISAQVEQRWAAGPHGLFALQEGALLAHFTADGTADRLFCHP